MPARRRGFGVSASVVAAHLTAVDHLRGRLVTEVVDVDLGVSGNGSANSYHVNRGLFYWNLPCSPANGCLK